MIGGMPEKKYIHRLLPAGKILIERLDHVNFFYHN